MSTTDPTLQPDFNVTVNQINEMLDRIIATSSFSLLKLKVDV